MSAIRNVRVTSSRTDPDRIAPAAAYVRMSTDHQKYSTENQLQTIRRYAEQRGFEIVNVYEDSGRSGLRLDGREGLQRLMRDVQTASPGFVAILVYDVSRWGRFQDADEGAYHEHLCSRSGIRVHYCGEQFENDGSIGSILLKSVKRVMAGEYSRELSVKVFAGQCRLIEHGFRQGGPAGFGLRRQLIDEHNNEKSLLERGDRKSLQTDRVVLRLGPEDEVDQVRRIYRMFIDDRRTEREIAEILNRENVLSDYGRPWTRASIHQILTNEKYVGSNIFNRVSFKLKQRRVRNHPDTWVRADNSFPPIVDRSLFAQAQSIIEARYRSLSDDQLLTLLQTVLKDEGALSGLIIDERDDLPSSGAYRNRFGSLLRAYTLIGYVPDRDYRYIEINRTLREAYPEIFSRLLKGIEQVGGTATVDRATNLIDVNGEFTTSLIIARSFQSRAGALRWRLRFDASLLPDLTIAVRMDANNEGPLDYYLLPRIGLSISRINMAESNPLALDAYRCDSLDCFFDLAARRTLREAA